VLVSKNSGAREGKFWCCEEQQKRHQQKDYQNHHGVASRCFQSILEALEGDLHQLCFHYFLNQFPEILIGNSRYS
jgi:hypothetical protein